MLVDDFYHEHMYVFAVKRGDDSSHRRLFSLYARKEEKEDTSMQNLVQREIFRTSYKP